MHLKLINFFLFKLVNDPDVIKNSLSNKMITFKEHTEWFNKTKKNKNSKIYIFLNHCITIWGRYDLIKFQMIKLLLLIQLQMNLEEWA